jgi:hypothetical protein
MIEVATLITETKEASFIEETTFVEGDSSIEKMTLSKELSYIAETKETTFIVKTTFVEETSLIRQPTTFSRIKFNFNLNTLDLKQRSTQGGRSV